MPTNDAISIFNFFACLTAHWSGFDLVCIRFCRLLLFAVQNPSMQINAARAGCFWFDRKLQLQWIDYLFWWTSDAQAKKNEPDWTRVGWSHSDDWFSVSWNAFDRLMWTDWIGKFANGRDLVCVSHQMPQLMGRRWFPIHKSYSLTICMQSTNSNECTLQLNATIQWKLIQLNLWYSAAFDACYGIIAASQRLFTSGGHRCSFYRADEFIRIAYKLHVN